MAVIWPGWAFALPRLLPRRGFDDEATLERGFTGSRLVQATCGLPMHPDVGEMGYGREKFLSSKPTKSRSQIPGDSHACMVPGLAK